MSAHDNGGPAFPGVEYKAPAGGGSHMMTIVGGMTMRDYLAAKAMQGELAAMTANDSENIAGLALDVPDETVSRLARHWYRIADAMLAERAKVKP